MNINDLDSTNKYVQGSVWQWESDNVKKAGVQSSERPVVVISNNAFNQRSPSVTCASITSVLKESPVHVPLYISKDSHIQCEQIHTIPKGELTEYKGIIPNSTLSQVKAKLRIQFDMSTDRNTELFMSIKRSLDDLNRKTDPDMLENINLSLEMLHEKADKGFGLPETENEFIKLMLELHSCFDKIVKEVESIKSNNIQKNDTSDVMPGETHETVTNETTYNNDNAKDIALSSVTREKGQRRNYTDADKNFIADGNNSIEILMDKYGYTKQAAHRMRAYFRKRLGNAINSGTLNEETEKNHEDDSVADSVSKEKSRKQVHRKYSEEDKRFIADENNSLEDLMNRFQYKDKQAAYKARVYIQKNYVLPNE